MTQPKKPKTKKPKTVKLYRVVSSRDGEVVAVLEKKDRATEEANRFGQEAAISRQQNPATQDLTPVTEYRVEPFETLETPE